MMTKETLECYARDYFYYQAWGTPIPWEELAEETRQLYRDRVLLHFYPITPKGTDD